MFVFQFCDVATMANIHKKKEPNLAIGKRKEETFCRICICFSKPSKDEVDICESSMNRYVSHRCKILHSFLVGLMFVWQVSFSIEMFYVFWMWPRQKNTIDMQIARSFSHMFL
jgi:hypothetical protein